MMKTLPRRGIRPVQAESQFNRDDTGQARMPPEKFRLRCVTHKNPSTDALLEIYNFKSKDVQ